MYCRGKTDCSYMLLAGGKVMQPPHKAIWYYLSKSQMHTFDPEMPLTKIYSVNILLSMQNTLYTKLCIVIIFT